MATPPPKGGKPAPKTHSGTGPHTFIGIFLVLLIFIWIVRHPNLNSTSTNTNSSTTNNTATKVAQKSMNTITLNTNMGQIVFETYNNDAPRTVQNFIDLANKGFYNNLIFHRVISGFMIQGGDPSGNGTGGPGYDFPDELNPNTASYQAGYTKGVVAMANRGPNTNGSQFFIMLADNPLPHNYTIFGKVISGQDVVDRIGLLPVDASDKPLTSAVINSVVVK